MEAKWKLLVGVFCIMLGVLVCDASATVIYELGQIDSTTWEYSYEVRRGQDDDPIRSLTIWFDTGLYSDLTIASSPVVGENWSEVILLSVPELGNGYDIFSEKGVVDVGEIARGFAVRFKWLGEGTPGGQPFHILDPVTFEPTYEGVTIPEPVSLLLMLGGGLLLRRRKMSRTEVP